MTSRAPSNTPIDGTLLPVKLCHLVSLQLGSENEPVTRLRKSSEIQNPASMWRRLISVPASKTSPLSLASISTPTSPTTFRPRLFAADRPSRSSMRRRSALHSRASAIASASPAPKSCLSRFTRDWSLTDCRLIQEDSATLRAPYFSVPASTTSVQTASGSTKVPKISLRRSSLPIRPSAISGEASDTTIMHPGAWRGCLHPQGLLPCRSDYPNFESPNEAETFRPVARRLPQPYPSRDGLARKARVQARVSSQEPTFGQTQAHQMAVLGSL